jgi:hypothetical protein
VGGSFVKGAAVGFVCAVLGGAAVASAGMGVGGVFNLGQTNSVDGQTALSGSTATAAQLRVVNTNTGGNAGGVSAAGASGIRAALEGTNSSGGPGVTATSTTGLGVNAQTGSPTLAAVRGQNTNAGAGGAFISATGLGVTGSGPSGGGVFTGSNSLAIGVKGSNNTNPGYGVWGESKLGTGVYGTGGDHGGFFTSTGIGLEGVSTKDDGVRGGTSAANKSGVWGHHDGNKSYGFGVSAQSDDGPALALTQGPGNTAPPVLLNGNPFPEALDSYKDAVVDIPTDSAEHQVASLALDPGSYVVIAKASALGDDFAVIPNIDVLQCHLTPNVPGSGDFEQVDQGVNDLDVRGINGGEFSLMLFHTFTTSGTAVLGCVADTTSDTPAPQVFQIRMIAIKIAGGTTTALP